MLVYGDVERIETVGAKLATIGSNLAEVSRLRPGIERHSALVTAFITASELVQGVLDAEFEERGLDARSDAHDRGMGLLTDLARCVHRSWRDGFSQCLPPASFLERLAGLDRSLSIRTKRAEGYAFYALYPECYLEAAERSRLGPDTRVIGIRSIGAGLGSLVAAALGTSPPLTVRPVGHPFRREVRVSPAMTEEVTAHREAAFAIVDEGPGLSGSSFGAVADWLEAAGVARERIHFFPSHGGDLGPRASGGHRERWSAAARHVVTMDQVMLDSPPPWNLSAWVEEIVGPLDEPLEEISAGVWRERRYRSEDCWPAANIRQERRKFLARAHGATWIVKFVGLGDTGLRNYRRARRLQESGLTPEIAGYRHGFLVERWHEGAPSLDRTPVDRRSLVEQVGSYLAFRVRHLPAEESHGASLVELASMACFNTQQVLGKDAAAALECALQPASAPGRSLRRVETDNRMHAWEWLVLGGRLVKTDALDHSATHDLVGCQDIAWDVAGAMIELALSEEETARLCAVVRQEGGHRVSSDLLSFMAPCYLAFQMGSHMMAADALGTGPEAERLRRAANRYAALLRRWQDSGTKLAPSP